MRLQEVLRTGASNENKSQTYNNNHSPSGYKIPAEAIVNNPARGVYIEGREHVVEDDNLCLGINCPSKRNASLLATAESHALFAHCTMSTDILLTSLVGMLTFRLVSRIKQRQISLQRTLRNDWSCVCQPSHF